MYRFRGKLACLLGKARRLPLSESPERGFTQVGSSLTGVGKVGKTNHRNLTHIECSLGVKAHLQVSLILH
jgi:hypothetical protein